MLFGTSKRLSKLTVNLNICYGGEALNQTNRYKYLGTLLDPSLNLNNNFNVTCKIASSFLRLLGCKCVYQSMVVPLLTYNCIANLDLNRTQLGRFFSLGRRVSQILGEPMTPIFNLITKCQLETMENYLKFCKSSLNLSVLASSSWVQESSIFYPWNLMHHLQMTSRIK